MSSSCKPSHFGDGLEDSDIGTDSKLSLFTAVSVRKRCGKKEPPLRTVDEGLYWAVALGQNSRGRVSEETKGVCEV